MGAPAPALALRGVNVRFALAGEEAEATPEGGLFLTASRTLIVSDLHLEKGSAFARRGQMLPPYDTRSTLQRLADLMARLQPTTVVSLGDTFHDRGAYARMDAADIDRLDQLSGAAQWVWIVGNHDPDVPGGLKGEAAAEWRVGALTLRHEPEEGPATGEVAGHLHPCAKVSGRGRAVRARCFATDGLRLVMPAFGAFTGGLNLQDEAFAAVFPNGALALMTYGGRVYPAPPRRQTPDG
jgi:hypothetical protein